MAPATKKRREKTTTMVTTTRRVVTRSFHKKQQLLLMMEKKKSASKKCCPSFRKLEEQDRENLPTTKTTTTTNKSFDEIGCTTPKSDKYKIPEIVTCPPAPKKPRVSPSNNCLVQTRRPISFFAHPDIDKFFMFATRDHIKV